MAKKKKQKYVRIVKKDNNNWFFKTELGFVIATYLVSFIFLSTKMTGNVILGTVGQGFSVIGAVLFVFALIQTLILFGRKK